MAKLADHGAASPEPPPGTAIGSSRYAIVLSLVLLGLMALELARFYLGGPLTNRLANIAVILTVLQCSPLVAKGLREALLMLAALVLSAAVLWTSPTPFDVFDRAFAQAGFLMAFILLIGLLREAALTSRSVLACGSYIAGRPEGTRYLSLQAGSHLLGVIINVGAISLLTPLVQRGVRARAKGDHDDTPLIIQEQRQLAATLRGMPWAILWAPTTITQAMLPTIIPGIDLPRLFALGLMTAVIVSVLGVIDDRLRWRRARLAAPSSETAGAMFPSRAFANFFAVCIGLAGLAGLIVRSTGVPVVAALMLAAPFVLVVWLMLQSWHESARGALAALRTRLGDITFSGLPNQRREVLILGLSGFIGICLAAVIPTEAAAELVRAIGGGDRLLLALLPLLIYLGAQFGLTPIISVIVLASVLGTMPQLPADPTLLALSLACGWALAMIGGPFSSLVLLLSRISGYSPTRIAWGWSAPYSGLAALVLALLFGVLAG